jgi:hypothetical protein
MSTRDERLPRQVVSVAHAVRCVRGRVGLLSGWEQSVAASGLPFVLEAAFHGLLEFGEILPDDGQIEFPEDFFFSFPC